MNAKIQVECIWSELAGRGTTKKHDAKGIADGLMWVLRRAILVRDIGTSDYHGVFAGAGFCAGYDVVNGIIEIERRLSSRLTWEHVRGHQDDERRREEVVRAHLDGNT